MAEGEGSAKRAFVWIASGLAVAGIAAMVWMWRGGGVQLGPSAEARAPIEECNATVSGSTAMTPKLAPEVAAAFLAKNGYTVERSTTEDGAQRIVGTRGALLCTISVRVTSSTQGLRDLADRTTLIALSQRPINQRDAAFLQTANAGDFIADRALAEHVVGFDAYAVTVHADNPVRALSTDQIRDIVTGVKTNWSEVGGADLPFTLYTGRDGVMTEDYPNDLVPHPSPLWDQVRRRSRLFATEAEAAAAIAQDPSAFGSISSAFVVGAPGVRALEVSTGGAPGAGPSAENVRGERYAVVRRLFVYVRPADMRESTFVQNFVRFFGSRDAFDVIDRAGFVALRPESRMSRAAPQLGGCRYGTAEYAALISATQGASRLPVALRFEGNSLRLNAEASDFVRESAADLRRQVSGGASIILIGHGDNSGAVADNRGVALRRALAVRAAFERQGLLGLEVESAGEQCPSGDNDTPEGREQNRRVEVWIKPNDAPS
ncbi:MAG: substrate-binding domain-containing protein [Hyphomonadaceae bacterium]|nr:substrate-binding domain-containing protein [Hyphomonadaceae bacterium]